MLTQKKYGDVKMEKKIDDEIIRSFLNCRYKAFLKFNNKVGYKSEYELLEYELSKKCKENFLNKLFVKPDKIQLIKKFEPEKKIKYQVLSYIIEPIIQSNEFLFKFDAIEINPSKDPNEDPLYVPISISPKEKLLNIEKLLLIVKSRLLADLNGKAPEYAKIIHGKNLKSKKFKIKKIYIENLYSRNQ